MANATEHQKRINRLQFVVMAQDQSKDIQFVFYLAFQDVGCKWNNIYVNMENRNIYIKSVMPTDLTHTRRKSRTLSSFLKKTYDILDEPDNHHAVRWADDGVGFIVVKEQEFSKQILPRYFKHSNYSSFVRQLNMYNFHKIREGNHESHFHHQSFCQNNRDLLMEIKRKPEKKKRKNQQSDDQMRSRDNMNPSIKNSISIIENQHADGDQVGEEVRHIKSWKQGSKSGFQNTRHMCVSEKQQAIENSSKEKVSIQNIFYQENDDDKISINNQLVQMFPRCPTKQIFYPSNNNIYPFPYGGPLSNFNIFF